MKSIHKSPICFLATLSLLLCPASLFATELTQVGTVTFTDENAAIGGIAFRLEDSVRTLYAADSKNSKFDSYDLENNVAKVSYATDSYAYAAAVGAGDFNPEYYVSASDGRILRYNSNTGKFTNAIYAPMPVMGITSDDSSANYAGIWAIQTNSPNVILLQYTAVSTVQKTIVTKGTKNTGVAVGPNHDICVLEDHTISEYKTDGTLVTSYTVDSTIDHPIGIAYDTVKSQFLISNGTASVYKLQPIPKP